MPRLRHLTGATALVIAAATAAVASQDAAETSATFADDAIAVLVRDAARLSPLIETRAARELLAEVPGLPAIESTTIHYRRGANGFESMDAEAFERVPEPDRADWRAMPVDTNRYYGTFYGSPLASMRAFDLAAAAGDWDSYDGRRVVDFGYGSLGQLHLLAACGATVVGTEVMPLLETMYADAEGTITGDGGRSGSIELAWGLWPADADVKTAVGSGADLFISKNTLKRGYVRPQAEAAPGTTIDLGVTPEAFLTAMHDVLRPGGIAVIYNIGGTPAADAPYSPMTDIACPWSRAECEAAGFDVVAFDADDQDGLRFFGRALGWDSGAQAMDLDEDVRATFTILRRAG